jgi:hypothetical protein
METIHITIKTMVHSYKCLSSGYLYRELFIARSLVNASEFDDVLQLPNYSHKYVALAQSRLFDASP